MTLPLLLASIVEGDLQAASELLDADPNLVKASDSEGASALHHAALHGRRTIVRLLVERGANVNARDGRYGATPAGWAIGYLRQLGGLLATEIDDCEHAVKTGDVQWVERLLDRYPDLVDATGSDGISIRKTALAAGHTEIVDLFTSPDPGAR